MGGGTHEPNMLQPHTPTPPLTIAQQFACPPQSPAVMQGEPGPPPPVPESGGGGVVHAAVCCAQLPPPEPSWQQ